MLERLQKIIANAGLTSRRKAEELIQEGLVTVNGQIVTELGAKADPDHDHIKVNGRLLNTLLERKEKTYYLLNKPKGYLSSLSDPEKRPLVTAFLPSHAPRVYPVGRLDFNTEGLLILTNDGELSNLITKAGKHCPKVYHVKVKGSPSPAQVERLMRGLKVEDQYFRMSSVEHLEGGEGSNTWYEVTLHEGKNNQIRKMFDEIGHSVLKLRRVAIGHLTDHRLPLGEIRELSEAEVQKFFRVAKAVEKAKAAQARGEAPASQAVKPLTPGAKQKLGKPKPIGRAKTEQQKRLTKTIGKDVNTSLGRKLTRGGKSTRTQPRGKKLG
ncbi:MAG: rRNA pseudouridine synthase [Blastocatellia bacterium]|nr:rRNA pseudouridine synthase [Blastocatellia bacterium]HMW02805.1 pseudouridine synthase [Acidobacteriota bacterium]